MPTAANDYTLNELMCAAVSRELKDRQLGYVGIGSSGRSLTLAVGIPIVATRLAQLSHAPDFGIFWDNLMDPDLSRIPPELTPYALANWPAAASLTTGDGNDMFLKGCFDIGFVSGAQIDRFGNMNITAIGDYRRPKVRLVGSLAQTEHLASARKPICITDLSARVFVENVDFVTSVGYLRGGNSRVEAGLWPLHDYTIVTDHAIFGFHPQSKQMMLRSLHPGSTVQDILDNMSFRPLIAEDIPQTEPPTDEQVRLIRDVIDPNRILLLE